MNEIFIEAESFKTLGGWVTDSQSMEQMGSAYIMAHGLGVPVRDAETEISAPADGVYKVYARTRDWTAVWGRGVSAGRFQIHINGAALPETLGTNGCEWSWQKAGDVRLTAGKNTISLRDLTGFNGRCDALYFTDGNDAPPNGQQALEAFRARFTEKPFEDKEEYDLLVAGGGIAGICAALSAMRYGLKVILIHDRSVLGGCNSSEVRVNMGGTYGMGKYPKLGQIAQEIEPVAGGPLITMLSADYCEDARKLNAFESPRKARWLRIPAQKLVLNRRVIRVETDAQNPKRITACIAKSTVTGRETRYAARYFADCTGDASLARYAGARVMYGTEARAEFGESLAPEKASKQVMGHSVIWHAAEKETAAAFPDVDWGVAFDESKVYYKKNAAWEWECGQYRNQAEETEYIRDYGLMTIFANWSYIKNRSARKKEFENCALEWASPIGGKRESYRVAGDLVLTQRDVDRRKRYPDATAAMTWNIDLHYPDPDNEEKFPEPFISCAYHRGIPKAYEIPYRCLYAKDLENLFLGGRAISVSHVVFACARVMRTLGALGEVVGMSAKICKDNGINPRQVYTERLDELISYMKKGAPAFLYHSYGFAENEYYHFGDAGHIHPDALLKDGDNKNYSRIKKLGVKHRKEWADALKEAEKKL